MNEALQVDERRAARNLDEGYAEERPVQGSGQSPAPSPNSAEDEKVGPLLPQDSVQDFRTRWDRVQTTFVDEPRAAVEQADQLVNDAIQRLSTSFTEARNNLERQWDRGDEVNTEDLRQALRKYRAFFQRLLAV